MSGSELSPAGCETTVESDISKRLFLMKRVSVRLYWIAVASNMMALGILLRGVLVPLGREGANHRSDAHCNLNDLLVGVFPRAQQIT